MRLTPRKSSELRRELRPSAPIVSFDQRATTRYFLSVVDM
jgi:hypothetical protein